MLLKKIDIRTTSEETSLTSTRVPLQTSHLSRFENLEPFCALDTTRKRATQNKDVDEGLSEFL